MSWEHTYYNFNYQSINFKANERRANVHDKVTTLFKVSFSDSNHPLEFCFWRLSDQDTLRSRKGCALSPADPLPVAREEEEEAEPSEVDERT